MDETSFQLSMLRQMLKEIGWNFILEPRGWTATDHNSRPLGYWDSEEHNVILRAATMTAGRFVQ